MFSLEIKLLGCATELHALQFGNPRPRTLDLERRTRLILLQQRPPVESIKNKTELRAR